MRYVCTVESGRTIPTSIRRILVPVDFSEPSAAALDYAIDLASRHGASVDVLHVYYVPPYAGQAQYAGHDGRDEYFSLHVHELATRRLNELIADHQREGVEINGILKSGEPIVVIPKVAELFDLIVMGANADDEVTNAKHLFFGRVSERVAGDVSCPLVTIRREEDRPGDAAERSELRTSVPSRM